MIVAAADPPARVEGLDTCRALLMLGGLLVHASAWQQPSRLFEIVIWISQSFRMGSFFAMSGFLSGMALTRRPIRVWLRRRLVQIGAPTLFGLLVVCPLIRVELLLLPRDHPGPEPLAYDWHHYWFLVALLLYFLLAAAAVSLERRRGLLTSVVERFCRGDAALAPLLLATGAVSLALTGLVNDLLVTLRPAERLGGWSDLRLVAGYAPDYLLGLAIAQCCGLRNAMLVDWRSSAAILASFGLLYLAWFAGLADLGEADLSFSWGKLLLLTGGAFCPPAAFVLIFRAAMAIRRTPAAVRRLADASFTMYVAHYPIAVLANMVWLRVEWNLYLEYLLTVAISGGLSFLLHRSVVRRSPLLLLLLSGRLPAQAGEAQVGAAAAA